MNEKSEITAAIAGSKLFSNICKEAIENLAGIAHKIILPPDSLIVRRGDRRISCYIIASGHVKLFGIDRTGQEYEFAQLGPGESFEEVALLTDEAGSLSIRTVMETSLIVLPRDQFNTIMMKYPDVASAIGKGITHWLNGSYSSMGDLPGDKKNVRRLRWFDYALIIGLSVLGALSFNISNPKGIPLIPKSFSEETVAYIAPDDAFKKKQEGKVTLLDTRPPESYEQEHIAGAENLPLAIFDFMYDLNLGQVDKAKEIIVYGRTISKLYDEEVAKKLVARGHTDVKIMQGGLNAWKKNGYQVEP